MEAFLPMCQKNKEFQSDEENNSYYNSNSDCDSENKYEDKENYVYYADLNFNSNRLERKKIKDKENKLEVNLFQIEKKNETTSPSTNDIKMKISNPFDISKEKFNYLDKKREKESKEYDKFKNKGIKKNQQINVYKNNFFNDCMEIACLLFQKTNCYIKYKRNLNILKSEEKKLIYKKEGAKDNLVFLDYKLKDVLSKDKINEEIIKEIIEENDYPPLIEYLNESIEDLMFYYSCNKGNYLSKYYISELKKRYNKLIEGFKIKPNYQKYLELFEERTKNIRETFKCMKEKSDKRKNRIYD